MATVNQMLQGKGREVYTVDPQMTVLEALQMMADRDVGALVVVEGDDIAGIFSERDYARKIVLLGKSSRETPVSEIMTARRIRHLPVLDADGRLAGIISIGDVVKAIISDQRVMINHLEDYIHG